MAAAPAAAADATCDAGKAASAAFAAGDKTHPAPFACDSGLVDGDVTATAVRDAADRFAGVVPMAMQPVGALGSDGDRVASGVDQSCYRFRVISRSIR